MHPTQWAGRKGSHPAIIMAGSDESLDYAELEARANRGAHLFRQLGLKAGDVIAVWADNGLDYLPVCWAAERTGLFFVPVPARLKAAEALYILRDSNARALILSATMGAESERLLRDMAATDPDFPVFVIHGELPGCPGWKDATAHLPATPVADEAPGRPMLYSSGTTGQPKGIVHPRRDGSILDMHPYEAWLHNYYDFDENSIFLSPAPLYHAAPLMFSMTVHRLGGTVVLMERFDAGACLAAIARYRVTHTQLVPTMFVRMLRLPQAARQCHDLSSLRTIIHAGSPCPVAVKKAMMDWLGPIVHEYYGASEGFGRTCIGPEEWLARPGSVGRATQGTLHICDEAGKEVEPGEAGTVYFDSDISYHYHHDPEKTDAARHPHHPSWRTLGDIGHVDTEGYLWLTDRRAFTIISGGVNIYPQETENMLAGHPLVADVAVFGVPDPEMGEAVVAVVEPAAGEAGLTEQDLIEWCRARLSHYKCPRQIIFDTALPREPTGKLLKKQLRERYLDLRTREKIIS